MEAHSAPPYEVASSSAWQDLCSWCHQPRINHSGPGVDHVFDGITVQMPFKNVKVHSASDLEHMRIYVPDLPTYLKHQLPAPPPPPTPTYPDAMTDECLICHSERWAHDKGMGHVFSGASLVVDHETAMLWHPEEREAMRMIEATPGISESTASDPNPDRAFSHLYRGFCSFDGATCERSCEMSESCRRWEEREAVRTVDSSGIPTGESTIPTASDPVNHPSHYGGDTPYEVIKVAEAWGFADDAYRFMVLKYTSRAGKKDGTPSVQDLMKALFYLKRKIRLLGGDPDDVD